MWARRELAILYYYFVTTYYYIFNDQITRTALVRKREGAIRFLNGYSLGELLYCKVLHLILLQTMTAILTAVVMHRWLAFFCIRSSTKVELSW